MRTRPLFSPEMRIRTQRVYHMWTEFGSIKGGDGCQNSGFRQNSLILAKDTQNCFFFWQTFFILAKDAQNCGFLQNSAILAKPAVNYVFWPE